ncbi:MAG: glycine zipper 2TM domain-containing protein [Sulfurimonas sp.]|jgi:outer membrane lipoprotein SlyB|nr:glycine zipper 2TM domain-containing protein [Sulfurimonas sp.]
MKVVYMSILSLFLLAGCATNKGPEYDGSSYNQMKRIEIGKVVEQKLVVIKDDGSGKFLGAVVGAVLGSTVGRGAGTTLAMLGGGLAGGYAGHEVGKANGAELTVELQSGEMVVVVVKGSENIVVGDRVKIIKDGNKVARVDKIID